jgi:hypothetical protein
MMNEQTIPEVTSNLSINLKVGFWSAVIITVITVVTFGLALIATPGDVVPYPYLDTLKLFPRDYFWMFISIPMILTYVVLVTAINSSINNRNKIFSQIGVTFAIISASIILLDYFVQFTVVPANLLNGRTEGILLLTQYNPYGIFIAMEELGYIIMALSFLLIAPVFGKSRLESAIKWIFAVSFFATVFSFITVSIRLGLERGYIFEVIVISITWLTLIINGILLSIYFRNKLKNERVIS